MGNFKCDQLIIACTFDVVVEGSYCKMDVWVRCACVSAAAGTEDLNYEVFYTRQWSNCYRSGGSVCGYPMNILVRPFAVVCNDIATLPKKQ